MNQKHIRYYHAFAVLLPLILFTWVRSGRGMPERWMFLGGAVYYLVFLLCHRDRKAWFVRLIKDPFLYLGAGFCVLLGLQLWNSGRELVFNQQLWEWEYGPPPHAGWPSAITAMEAQQWLFVALWIVSMICVVRSLRFSVHQYRVMGRILLGNAILLFGLGMAQYVTGTQKQYWFHPLPGNFFSVFGYPNHAAAYFVLMFGVAFGFVTESLKRGMTQGQWRAGRLLFYGAAVICCALGAVLSLSRAGMLLVTAEIVFGVGYLLVVTLRGLTPTARINAVLVLGIVLLVFGAGLYGLGREKIGKELKKAYQELSITRLKNPPPKSLTGIRYPFWIASYRIWKDYPWTGCGSWGFRYLKKLYIPRDRWITKKGYANVHLDGLQFLAEYGVVGFGLLLAGAGVLLWRAFGWPFWFDPLYLFVFMGLGAVLTHSVIDLPFRCPAISGHWLLIAAIFGQMRKH
jgi:hypothetical protein